MSRVVSKFCQRSSCLQLAVLGMLLPSAALPHGSSHTGAAAGALSAASSQSEITVSNDDAGLQPWTDGASASQPASLPLEADDLIEQLPSGLVSRALQPPVTPVMSTVLGGAWSPLYDWPIVAIHAALLPNGKVLSWDATPDDADDDPLTIDNSTTRVTLWDPLTNTHVSSNNDTGSDLFCAGSAHLWDGRVLFAGGDSGVAGANGPLSHSNIYNPVSNTWHRTENMHTPRWYSSVAPLPNGEMLTFGGEYSPDPMGEVFQFDQTWRQLDIETPFEFGGDFQWLQTTPDGDVISFGPENVVASIETTGNGVWTTGPTRDGIELRDYGSYAMFDVGRILVSGGGNSESSAVIVNTATQQTTDTGSMNIGRRQHDLTILSDGSVLATGGNSDAERNYSATGGVFQPELYDPASGRWSLLNPMRGDRQYHSIALLLPDGRVLTGGGGICGDCYAAGYEERNAEIYSPPYLFDASGELAVRPELSAVPEAGNYGEVISVQLNSDTSIEKTHLIRLGSATHSQNQEQRLVPVAFSGINGGLSITLPGSRNVAPPGHYLLIVVDSAGVPSVGEVIRVGQPLVLPGQRVVTTLEADAWDTYRVQTDGGQLTLVASAEEPLELYVSRAGPVTAANAATAECRAVESGGRSQTCVVSARVPTDWYVTVHGQRRVDYALASAIDMNVVDTSVPEAPDLSSEPVTPASNPSDLSNPEGDLPTTGSSPVITSGQGPADEPLVDADATNENDVGSSGGTGLVKTGGSMSWWALCGLLALVCRRRARKLTDTA